MSENVKEKQLQPLKEESKAIVAFLQANDGEFTCEEIAEAVGQGPKSVNPRLTALVKRGLVAKVGSKDFTYVNSKGVETTTQHATYTITDAGKVENLD